MALFDVLATAGSGMTVYRTWLEAVSDNVANMNNVAAPNEPAYQERFVVAESVGTGDVGDAGGVRVADIEFGNPEGRRIYWPLHPFADKQGDVRVPDVDLADQMTAMIVAQRGYQANRGVITRTRLETGRLPFLARPSLLTRNTGQRSSTDRLPDACEGVDRPPARRIHDSRIREE